MASNNIINSSKNNRIPTNTDASAPAEFSAVVDDLLNTLSNKFAGVSSEIFAKMDEMSRRLDNLENTLKNNTSTENESPKK
ncbi:hypothetical protein EPUL_003689 [Erysiphe pulchra]|uniref:Heat shock factor binding protein 1 n=1 Tax=Erysiphe pulchra TaxID=225359 RepID=A0A2S4PMP5_9PEZI|nr:hypothetical protein EPUL_003689 [Erysiphe pulchra]